MAIYSTDRRSILKIIVGVGATCSYPFSREELFGNTADQHDHAPPQSRDERLFFGTTDFQTISRIADLIIPETDTPDAVGAGVPIYIDLMIARNTDQQLVVADGLRWLDSEAARIAERRFIDLSELQQISILEPLCEASDMDKNSRARNVQFFSILKSLTADGYYTSEIGLMQELRYKADATAGFPDCANKG